MKSFILESMEDAAFLMRQSTLFHGASHPTTLAASAALDYWFTKWTSVEGNTPMLSCEEINEQLIEVLHAVIEDQQHTIRKEESDD